VKQIAKERRKNLFNKIQVDNNTVLQNLSSLVELDITIICY